MSDLEATSSRGQSAAPITAIASARLRTISPGGPAFAQSTGLQSTGLVDAFAEVFARIASSARPVESLNPIANTSDSQPDSNDKTTHSDQDASSESESLSASPESESKLDVEQLVGISDDPVAVAEDQGTENGDQITEAENHEAVIIEPVSVVVDEDQTDQDDAGTESVVIAAVEVIQADPNESEIKSSDVIAPEVEQEDGRRRRREHGDSAAVDPVENTEGGRRHGERTSDDEQIHRTSEVIGESDEQSLESTDRTGREESSRTRGRPRYDRDSVDPTSRSASQANAARAQQGAADAASGDAADQIRQTADAPSQSTTRSVESAVVHVQSVAAKVQQTSTLTGSQPGTRGSTQAIESTTSMRSDASPKADSSDNKGNTAETVSRIKLIQRVSKAFQHLGPEGGTIRLRLAPAEMGSVRVEMRISQRKVQARVVAETEAASAALREHLPDLRARIESLGMQVERLEIETDGQDWHQESQFDAESREQQQQQRQNNRGSSRPNPGTNQPVLREVSQATPEYQVDGASGGVDVRF